MSFWHTVLAVVLANAIYDLLHMFINPDYRDEDDDGGPGYAV